VPQPLNWHDLQFLQLRIRDDKNIVLWVGFNEADRTFSLYNRATRRFGPSLAAGTRRTLTTPWATLNLAGATVLAESATSPTVTLNLPLTFKAAASGHTYLVEVAARDKAGHNDDLKLAGTLTVNRRR
jgi:hypothetical protein